MAWYAWRPYVPVTVRREIAAGEIARLRGTGRPIAPVTIEGRAIARSFWGKAWCDNLERYTRLANRLPRGRTYVRNGSVVDLQIKPGLVQAIVAGSEVYALSAQVRAIAPLRLVLMRSLGTSGAVPKPEGSEGFEEQAATRKSKTDVRQPHIPILQRGMTATKQIACQTG